MKKYIQAAEAKCNFCFDWFSISNLFKGKFNICNQCLHSVTHKHEAEVGTSSGNAYKLYLFGNHPPKQNLEESEVNQYETELLDALYTYKSEEVEISLRKWEEVMHRVETIAMSPLLAEKVSNLCFEHQLNCQEQTDAFLQKMDSIFMPPQTPLREIFWQGKLAASRTSQKSGAKLGVIQEGNNCSDSITKSIIMELNEIPAFQRSGGCVSGFSLKENQEFRSRIRKSGVIHQFIESRYQAQKLKYSAAKRDKKANIQHYLEQKNKVPVVMQKIIAQNILQALEKTTESNNCTELISFNVEEIDFECYLSLLDWENIEVLKLIKIGMTDQHFRHLLNVLPEKKVKTLVVTGNKLTEEAIMELEGRQCLSLQNIYMGKNQVMKRKVRKSINELKQRYTLYL